MNHIYVVRERKPQSNAGIARSAVAEAVLFGLSGRDPVVMGTAALTLAAVILVASWLPAWRASRIAPKEALRYE